MNLCIFNGFPSKMDKSQVIAELNKYISQFEVSQSGKSSYERYFEHQYNIVRNLVSNLDKELDDLVDKYEKYKKSLIGWKYKDFPEIIPKILHYIEEINKAYVKLDREGRRKAYEFVTETYYRESNHCIDVWGCSDKNFVYRVLEARGAYKYIEKEGPLFEDLDSLLERDKLEDEANGFELLGALQLLLNIVISIGS